MQYIFLALILLLSPFIVQAQNLEIGDQGLTIDLEPRSPDPFSEVEASLNDYSITAQVNNINWRVDGKNIPEFKNQRTIKFQTKEAGKEIVVEAIVELAKGSLLSTKRVIKPIYLDIIVEPQTRTPSFYLGRSLPSIGSKLNVTAVVSGSNVPQEDFIYNWKVNNVVIDGGATRGKRSAIIETTYDRFFLVSVNIVTKNGETIGSKTINVGTTEPIVYFYELNSLYGISNKPITNVNLTGSSISVQAEPYYLDISTFNNPDHIEWKIDNTISDNFTNNPYEITLAKPEGSSGTSQINFHVRNLTQLLQGGKSSFQINF